jgi:carboxymethylenebutenolidase
MCFDPTARPPLPPIAGGAGAGDTFDLILEAEDGNRFSAFTALATDPGAPGVVILPDIRGLHPFYRDLAERFAESGVHATVLDYFGRTAGTEARDDDFDFMLHVKQAQPDTVAADVAAAVAHVRSDAGGAAPEVFTVGFCFGGRNSFNQSGRGLGLAGVVGFYGAPQPREADDTNAPTLLAATYACPVLGLFGGADHGIPKEAIDAFDDALTGAGVEHEIVVYDGAPHSFFDRSFQEHADASADAWRRMLAFVAAGR